MDEIIAGHSTGQASPSLLAQRGSSYGIFRNQRESRRARERETGRGKKRRERAKRKVKTEKDEDGEEKERKKRSALPQGTNNRVSQACPRTQTHTCTHAHTRARTVPDSTGTNQWRDRRRGRRETGAIRWRLDVTREEEERRRARQCR